MDSSDDNQLGTLDDNEEHSRTSNDLQRKRAIAADKKRRFSDTFDPIGRAGHFGGLGDDDTIRHRKPKWRKGKKHNKHMYGLAHGIAGIGRATNFRKRSLDTTRRRSLLKGLQKRAFERVAAAKRQRQRRR